MKEITFYHYCNKEGKYLGCSDSQERPMSKHEVSFPPPIDSTQVWDYKKKEWGYPVPEKINVNFEFESKVLLAFISMINNGEIVPGKNISDAKLLRKIKKFIEEE